jgi:ubiquitin-conjugating enzyme E2 Z
MHDDEDILKGYALIVGPSDTPYFGGFYFFEIKYPTNYPHSPPHVIYCTNGENIRFNPNLYSCGTVCLSMLNTWQGPGWTPANTIHNVLIAIQSLVLNNNPLQNEPGFENASKFVLDKYNNALTYANIKITILELINDLIENKYPDNKFNAFKNVIFKHFIENIGLYSEYIMAKSSELNGQICDAGVYSLRLLFDSSELLTHLNNNASRLL